MTNIQGIELGNCLQAHMKLYAVDYIYAQLPKTVGGVAAWGEGRGATVLSIREYVLKERGVNALRP